MTATRSAANTNWTPPAARRWSAVTCREGSAWETRLAIAAEAGDATGYAPASSLDTLEGYLMAIGAGPALTPEEEAALLDPQGN